MFLKVGHKTPQTSGVTMVPGPRGFVPGGCGVRAARAMVEAVRWRGVPPNELHPRGLGGKAPENFE